MLRSLRRCKSPFSIPELALIVVTMVWGGSFLVVQIAMAEGGPVWFVAVRFLAAGGLMALAFARAMKGLTRAEILAGSAIGSAIFLGYALQTFGLQTIGSSKSAFITALYVPIVPLLQWLVLRRPPRLTSWAGIILAFLGLILLAGPEALRIGLGIGEVTTLLGAVAIAAEIILIGRFANEVDSRRITVVQLLAGGLFALVFAVASGESLPAFGNGVWLGSALALAVASAIIQLTMNWAQRSVSPTKATVIYAGEPVWAGVVGRIAGERLSTPAVIGGALIVLGVIVSELRPRRSFARRPARRPGAGDACGSPASPM
jgi:drug/metabolite transporter (DMT)-like permease